MILGSRILVEKSTSVNSVRNWALHSLPNPVPMVGTEGNERNVCSCVKNGGHWHDYPGHLGTERSTEVDGRISTVFLDNMGIERSLMWQFQERNLNLTQRWGPAHLHVGESLSLIFTAHCHCHTVTAGITGTSPGQKTHERHLHGLYNCHHTQQVPNWKFNIPPGKVIKQGGYGAGVALKPWQSVPTNQNLS